METPNESLDRILPSVEKPARYIGGEIHCVRKAPSTVRVRFALAFPDVYEIAMSHLGTGILYSILNSEPGVQAERVFAPWRDMEAAMRAASLPLASLDSGRPVRRFDIVGFSLTYELAVTNVLQMLDLAGIPLLAGERGPGDPIVIAGGPCTANPAPVAPFFDALVVGDGERAAPEIARRVADHKSHGSDRAATIRSLADIEGVYVPSLPNARARRAILEDLNETPAPVSLPIPWLRPVHDRVALEVARGCTAGCRFCQAGMIYRPVRERRPQDLLEWAEHGLASSGSDVLGLLSLSTGDYSSICTLAVELGRRHGPRAVSVSLPSLRIGSLTPDLIASLGEGRRLGFTVAPEAGTDRLRAALNKPMTDESVVAAARTALDAGWNSVKLYYMIGLPFEEDEDVRGIVAMSRKLAGIARGTRGDRKIVVNVSTFVPKAHTPFQWEGQASLDRIRDLQARLRSDLRGRALEVRWHDARLSRIEAVIARGDASIAAVILGAYRRGARFDAWTDSFDERAWEDAFSAAGIDPAFAAGKRFGFDEPLPWDAIDSRIGRDFLVREHQRALRGETTADCRAGGCAGDCGCCDFADVKNVVADPWPNAPRQPGPPVAQPRPMSPAETQGHRYRVWYRKTGRLRFLGHLDLVSALSRAIRRADVALLVSRGFHPLPRIRFGPALAVGIASLSEFLDVDTASELPPDTLRERLNACLPPDLAVEKVVRLGPHAPSPERSITLTRYRLWPNGSSRHEGLRLEEALPAALSSETLRISREGKAPLDIRPFLAEARLVPGEPGEVELALRSLESRSPRPIDAMEGILGLPAGALGDWRVLKIATETVE